jgi:hypothetical protein
MESIGVILRIPSSSSARGRRENRIGTPARWRCTRRFRNGLPRHVVARSCTGAGRMPPGKWPEGGYRPGLLPAVGVVPSVGCGRRLSSSTGIPRRSGSRTATGMTPPAGRNRRRGAEGDRYTDAGAPAAARSGSGPTTTTDGSGALGGAPRGRPGKIAVSTPRTSSEILLERLPGARPPGRGLHGRTNPARSSRMHFRHQVRRKDSRERQSRGPWTGGPRVPLESELARDDAPRARGRIPLRAHHGPRPDPGGALSRVAFRPEPPGATSRCTWRCDATLVFAGNREDPSGALSRIAPHARRGREVAPALCRLPELPNPKAGAPRGGALARIASHRRWRATRRQTRRHRWRLSTACWRRVPKRLAGQIPRGATADRRTLLRGPPPACQNQLEWQQTTHELHMLHDSLT